MFNGFFLDVNREISLNAELNSVPRIFFLICSNFSGVVRNAFNNNTPS